MKKISALILMICTMVTFLIPQNVNANPGLQVFPVYRAHVQDIGWQNWVRNGEVAGTTGQSKRIEAIQIETDVDSRLVGIEYRVHVQDIGWQNWVSNGQVAGTTGQSKRIEAIQIRLTGMYKGICVLNYQVHVEGKGWQNVVGQGDIAGTVGQGKRIEAIKIFISCNAIG